MGKGKSIGIVDAGALKLIREVERRPALWDVDSREYHNVSVRMTTWSELTAVFVHARNATPDEFARYRRFIRSKWRNLRDGHRRALVRKEGNQTRGSYKYFREMAFLNKNFDSLRNKRNSPVDNILNGSQNWNHTTDSNRMEAQNMSQESDRSFLLSLLEPMQSVWQKNKLELKKSLINAIETVLQEQYISCGEEER